MVDGVPGRVGDSFDYSGLRVLLGGEFVDRPALAVYPTTAQRIEGAVGVMLVVVLDQPAQAAVGEPSPCRRLDGREVAVDEHGGAGSALADHVGGEVGWRTCIRR